MRKELLLGTLLALAVNDFAAAQEVPLQRPEERQVTRRQSREVYDVLRPLVRPVLDSTVWVWAGRRQLALGTVVGDGTQVLTKWSEIALARGAIQCVGYDGKTASASVLGVYVDEDLAMLQLDGDRFTPVTWDEGEVPAIGRFVVAVGPTESGDPLGMGVISVAERSLRESDLAFLGIVVDHTYEGEGVLVDSVDDRGGADEAGVRGGDVLLELEGYTVSGGYELRNILLKFKPGDRLKAKILRPGAGDDAGERLEVEIQLGERPEEMGIPQSRLNVMRRMGGEISEVGDGFPMVLQTDMQLPKQQCGGPVVDLDGKVIGLAIARTDRTRSFIIPAAEIRTILGQKPVAPTLAQRDEPVVGPAADGMPRVRPRAVPMNPRAASDLRRHLEEMQALLDRMEREMESVGE